MPHFSLRSRILWPEIHNICNHIPFLSSPYLCHRTLFHQSVHPRSLWCSSHSRSPTHHPGIWPYGTPLVSQMRDGSSADGLLGPPHSVFSPFKAPCPGVVAEDPSSGSDQCPSLFSEYLSLHSLCLGRASLIAQLVKKILLPCRRPWSVPELGRSAGGGNGYTLQYSGLENSMDCISPWGRKELDMTEPPSVSLSPLFELFPLT